MKTPAELKSWLKNRNAMSEYSTGTLEYIDKLEGVVSDFIVKTAMLEKERDALLADLKEADMLECNHCRNFKQIETKDCDEADGDCSACRNEECRCKSCKNNSNWQWRGIKEDT